MIYLLYEFCIDKTGYEYYCINQVIQQYNNTEDVLKNLFREGINGLYYNLPVEVEKRVNFKVIAKISDKVYESNSTIKLLPDRKEEDNA